MAKRLNRAVGRRGSVFADRYHARRLTTPRETRLAIRYVLLNHRHHAPGAAGPDPHSIGPSFGGWKHQIRDMVLLATADPRTIARPKSWLLHVGSRRDGPISWTDGP